MTTLTPSEIEDFKAHVSRADRTLGYMTMPTAKAKRLCSHIDALAEERKVVVERLESIQELIEADNDLDAMTQFDALLATLRGES